MDVKHKTAIRGLCDAKSKRKAIRAGNVLCFIISKRLGHTQINKCVNITLYEWILKHIQVLQSPISNYLLKVSLDNNSETQMVPNTLLQVYVFKLHNIMVRTPEEVLRKEERGKDNYIIISDSKLRNTLPPQLKKMYARYNILHPEIWVQYGCSMGYRFLPGSM